MNQFIKPPGTINKAHLTISGSKSETNRLLILQKLYPNLILENCSDADDSKLLSAALKGNETKINIHHAGTAMRFLTAYFASLEGQIVHLTGSERMQERPMKILVDALKQLGANIEYQNKQGFPPLSIKGKKISSSKVSLPANVSSQFITALMLIAPKLENGLEINLEGEITSVSYIMMTLELLKKLEITASFDFDSIKIKNKSIIKDQNIIIESDWSSASYIYSIVALSPIGCEITLSSFNPNSIQGDSILTSIYKDFGVETTFEENSIKIKKIARVYKSIRLNLQNTPDLAQTIVVTCFGLGVGCNISGLSTLLIKETNRLEALLLELGKLGTTVFITNDSFVLSPSTKIIPNQIIETYNDHRMAMAFAPLGLLVPIEIKNSEVVSKSYPNFWKDLKAIGFQLEERENSLL